MSKKRKKNSPKREMLVTWQHTVGCLIVEDAGCQRCEVDQPTNADDLPRLA